MVAEISSLKIATQSVLRDIAKHAHTLATGLQNAAPPQDSGPAKSILYLSEIAVELNQLAQAVDGPSSASPQE
jgi:hypothetical protein